MTTLLFVHGTGARENSYAGALRAIREKVADLGRGWAVQGCYWGSEYGASTAEASVPAYQETGGDGPLSPEEQQIALWSILYTDPYYELRLLRLRPQAAAVPGLQPSQQLQQQVATYRPNPETRGFFAALHLDESLSESVREIATSSALAAASTTASPDLTEHRYAVARAIVAATLVRAASAGTPQVSAWMRDRLVESIAKDLAPHTPLGPSEWLRDVGVYIGSRVGTQLLLPRRGDVTDAAAPMAGDILRFLARPTEVEGYLATFIGDITDDVYLLGHSLGGIICVDLLARDVAPNVKGLITVGSQAPFFYEIGALPALQPGQPLPPTMPPWLNVFDRADVLAYIGERIFNVGGEEKPRVIDLEVTSGQPFPQSHGAYWHSTKLWDAMATFIV